MRQKLRTLHDQNKRLDMYLESMTASAQQIMELAHRSSDAYVTYEEARSAPEFRNQTLLAVQPPEQASVTVPGMCWALLETEPYPIHT